MQLKTLLNFVEPLKGFVYESVEFVEERIMVSIRERKNTKGICSGCGVRASCYDHLPKREFLFVPLWGIAVVFLYAMRRVNCRQCGVKVERVPWADGKSHSTLSLNIFLADWARDLSWQDVASRFRVTWDRVADAVKYVVDWGLENRVMGTIRAIGVDEKYFGPRSKYWTFVYQIDEGRKRLLYIAKGRAEKALTSFILSLDEQTRLGIRYVCSDMWKAYLNAVRKHLSHAVHILDRYHLVALLNKALNRIRTQEARELKAKGFDLLKHTKYCFLKRPENLTPKQATKLKEVLAHDLKSGRGYRLKESFQAFWSYRSPYWAQWFLKKWCTRAMRSKLEPIKKFVATVRSHEELILNYFRAKGALNSGVVEGLNRRVNSIINRAYGFRTEETLKSQLFHALGVLPQPPVTHRFC